MLGCKDMKKLVYKAASQMQDGNIYKHHTTFQKIDCLNKSIGSNINCFEIWRCYFCAYEALE